jgi:hypothetical protein
MQKYSFIVSTFVIHLSKYLKFYSIEINKRNYSLFNLCFNKNLHPWFLKKVNNNNFQSLL